MKIIIFIDLRAFACVGGALLDVLEPCADSDLFIEFGARRMRVLHILRPEIRQTTSKYVPKTIRFKLFCHF